MMQNLTIKTIYAWPLAPRLISFAVIFIFSMGVGYYLNLSSLQKELADAKQQESDLRQQLELVIAKNAELTAEEAKFNALEALQKQWQQKLMHHAELPELLKEILKIGGTDQLYFTLLNPGVEVADGIFDKLPIKMTVVGSYHQIAHFLDQIANLPKIIVIGDFTLSNETNNDLLGARLAEQAKANNYLTAELSFDVYHLPENKT